MLLFFSGFIAGVIAGVICMSLFVASSASDDAAGSLMDRSGLISDNEEMSDSKA